MTTETKTMMRTNSNTTTVPLSLFVCTSNILHKYGFYFPLGLLVSPWRKWKRCLCKILEGQTKGIMVFLKVAYRGD